MKTAMTFIGASLVGTLAFSGSMAGQQLRTQWDGVYAKAQANRGERLYVKYCASCHGPDLGGGEVAPGLTGGEFNANWNDLSLGALFERMRVSMPQNNPGSMAPEENADILAYILDKGSFPAGDTELPTRTELLSTIRFVAIKPAP
jgi:mono/diheme cytochrome c family protein